MTPERALEELKHELDLQIRELMRVLQHGGEVYYRSAGKKPWYNQRCASQRFERLSRAGLTVCDPTQIHARRLRR